MPLDPDRVLATVQAVMPANAEVQIVPGSDTINIHASWELNDDSSRPYKMSKTISICVSKEAAHDFNDVSAADCNGAYRRIQEFVVNNLAAFNPNHDAPKHERPPVERWVISSAVLHGT